MNTSSVSMTVLAAFGFALTACSSNSPVNLTHPPTAAPTQAPTQQKYIQIELMSRPAVKEVFEPFQDHQKTNVVEPYSDATISNDIVATEDALRPPGATTDYGKALQGILYPNEFLVNLNGGPPPALTGQFYLSTELTGGTAFGGRAPNDDVIDLSLSALFGNALTHAGVADDHEENDCLSSQNIPVHDPAKLTGNTFPYLAPPR